MSHPQAPYIVRIAPPPRYDKPGLHSHNITRRIRPSRRAVTALGGLRLLLLLFGVAALGYYGYTLGDQYVYQAFQNWAFDQEIAGRVSVTFADYIRERTPFGFVVGASARPEAASKPHEQTLPAPNSAVPRPVEGSVLGRVDIARLKLGAVVREGVDTNVLSVAVGHVPSTALPGQAGNFAIAAHRDTLFRRLKDIQRGDLVIFESPSGRFSYKVIATKIVQPSDVSVLRPDGGGLVPSTQTVSTGGKPGKLLTMITCYPFYYVGSAPKRFIVEAELIDGANSPPGEPTSLTHAGTAAPIPAGASLPPVRRKSVLQAEVKTPRPTRGVSHPAGAFTYAQSGSQKPRKHRLWRHLFHV